MRASDRWKTSFRWQLGQIEWRVVSFGRQGSSSESLVMRVMTRYQALTCGSSPAAGACLGRRNRWAGARGCIWTIVQVWYVQLEVRLWYIQVRPSQRCPLWNIACAECGLAAVDQPPAQAASKELQAQVWAAGAGFPWPPPPSLAGGRASRPSQGAGHSMICRVVAADVVHGGAELPSHGPDHLLPPVYAEVAAPPTARGRPAARPGHISLR
jgi:hypothetical protein